ncbi:arogenate dehydratase/prephenate dehydratase 1, chloroplastic-like isoform X2 [Lycium barbarum]|uniref:arogenate dehydratase/prephenate dehydratase 1, chloroplastic-like isoform X2 n=1 Tax=Lycium barbarum TaxID=112863 RepID=UPI00293E29F6|nr:arogenate dehydratase/prephenate dehydratase 1, chloroplastic-like isoform X2 [Lycium barbarum]
MALNILLNIRCFGSQLGVTESISSKHCGVGCHGGKNGVLGGLFANFKVRSVEDESTSNSDSEMQRPVDQTETKLDKKFPKDLSSLPRPLSITEASSDGSKVRISFKGVPGAYSEEAALKAYPQCETVPCDEFEDAFKAVEQLLAEKAVLPIENSLSGSIHWNYDLLLRHRLHIVGEVQLAVNFCLLALPGVRMEHVKRVLSHPQALAHSDSFLSKLGVIRENVDDAAGAAQLLALKKMMDAGVVAGSRAAAIYGLNVLAESIQDNSDSITRFLVLARDPIIPSTDKSFKTSIVFSLEDGPGVPFKALAVFAIESRPQRKQPLRVVDAFNTGTAKYFDYLFYIDFEASMAEPRVQYALGHLQVCNNNNVLLKSVKLRFPTCAYCLEKYEKDLNSLS